MLQKKNWEQKLHLKEIDKIIKKCCKNDDCDRVCIEKEIRKIKAKKFKGAGE